MYKRQVFGYVDGEYTSFETNDYFYPGDVLDITYKNGVTEDMKVVFSPLNCDVDYKTDCLLYTSFNILKQRKYGRTFITVYEKEPE